MFRPLGRAVRDTIDNLLPFTLASFAWWVSVLLIVTAPAGTLALFAFADPRRLDDHQRMQWQEALAMVRRDLFRAWGIAVAVGIPLLMLVNNLVVYRDGWLRWFAPFWIVLLLLVVAAGGVTCSMRAVLDRSSADSLRQAVVFVLARAPTLVPIVLVLWLIIAIGGVLVIPALMFVPALVAVTFNHIVYDTLGIVPADPLEPTDERRAEDGRTRGGKYSVG